VRKGRAWVGVSLAYAFLLTQQEIGISGRPGTALATGLAIGLSQLASCLGSGR
jgi:hypothetical protein